MDAKGIVTAKIAESMAVDKLETTINFSDYGIDLVEFIYNTAENSITYYPAQDGIPELAGNIVDSVVQHKHIKFTGTSDFGGMSTDYTSYQIFGCYQYGLALVNAIASIDDLNSGDILAVIFTVCAIKESGAVKIQKAYLTSSPTLD